ncbi:MAG: D-Ala-D-Ala carboxypeptidase family metallohydrolase [Ruminococcus sp.]|nr:D-Ala-D-Ala carboxypeptidase family metallohydrolase [Ruminococcus sp.]
MSVNHYDYNDSTQLSPHFNVREFRCQCGQSHETLIASELVDKLESLYTALNCSKIIVTSGYRCPEHDKAVGGTSSGQHTKGTAADVCCYGQDGQLISSKTVCCKAQDLGFGGIANITSSYQYTHLDVRTGYRWLGDETKGNGTVTDDFYKYFGIEKAETKTKNILKGIDVSYAQGVIDWEKVKASGLVDFAILRAGYGKETTQVDTQFERNYAACKRLGIPVGVYWYSYATTAAESEQEAKVCLQTIRGKQFEYPVAFDIEEKESLQNADALCQAFCSALEKQGYYAAIYTFKSALENNISAAIKSRYDIFLSHVGVQQTSYAGAYGLWQYSWTGRIPGITGDVDLNYAYKNYPAIIKQAGLNGFGKTEPEPEPKPTPEPDSEENTLQQILKHVANIDEKINGNIT